jgi:hypothetical protein
VQPPSRPVRLRRPPDFFRAEVSVLRSGGGPCGGLTE